MNYLCWLFSWDYEQDICLYA